MTLSAATARPCATISELRTRHWGYYKRKDSQNRLSFLHPPQKSASEWTPRWTPNFLPSFQSRKRVAKSRLFLRTSGFTWYTVDIQIRTFYFCKANGFCPILIIERQHKMIIKEKPSAKLRQMQSLLPSVYHPTSCLTTLIAKKNSL